METSYKEKYEQAIERLKQWDREHPCAGFVLSDRDKFIFPELAESEDEKMMKEIIELVMQPVWKTEKEFHRRYELCAWLKKQVEHANFLSKIQVDDKVTRNEAGVLVNLSQLNRVAKKNEKQGEGIDYANKEYWRGYREGKKEILDKYAEQSKQKSVEWSEEDKNFMYDTLSNLTELKDRYGEGYGNVGRCIDWLNGIKQRIKKGE